jgi:hypothetical protein
MRAALIALTVGSLSLPNVIQAQTESLEKTSVIPITANARGPGQPATADVIKSGDSSRRTRAEAIEQLPTSRLAPEAQQSVERVIKELSLFRRLPTLEFEVDPRVYDFFTSHPDMAVSIWRAMNISSVRMWQTGPSRYELDTRDGTVGQVDVLLRSPESCLIQCDGQLQGPGLSKAITASALMHLQTRYTPAGKAVHHVDLFVSFPSQTVETIAKLISPVSNRVADRNFEEVSLFIAMMNSLMSRQPGWVEQICSRLEGVLPECPQQLLATTAAVYVDAEKRRLAAEGLPVTLEAIRPPVIEQASADSGGDLKR